VKVGELIAELQRYDEDMDVKAMSSGLWYEAVVTTQVQGDTVYLEVTE
jgi:hypothetical protein